MISNDNQAIEAKIKHDVIDPENGKKWKQTQMWN